MGCVADMSGNRFKCLVFRILTIIIGSTFGKNKAVTIDIEGCHDDGGNELIFTCIVNSALDVTSTMEYEWTEGISV